jgi:hypothetical protein
MTFPRFAALLVISLAFPAALKAQENLPDVPFFPLKVGNTWTYKVGENHFSYRIAKIEKVGGTPCARVEMLVQDKPVSFEHIGIHNGAIARFSFEGKEIKPPIPLLKANARKGDSWPVESKIGDGQVIKGKFVVGEDLDFSVPAGRGHAITVTAQDMEVNGVKLNVTYFLTEKMGMVKQVADMAGKKIVIELEKFEPGK